MFISLFSLECFLLKGSYPLLISVSQAMNSQVSHDIKSKTSKKNAQTAYERLVFVCFFLFSSDKSVRFRFIYAIQAPPSHPC
ncbi:uncharacterized protein SOCG_05813 [Schizosaccharomyces octosporus yFS286]|uniref:Secreted protein n=1 Tax=Schizosaccharomyces octosporus (strain yFS286) TaxID=483514 RepID=S9PW13_SCHOY|nr:uncharacterized protein SOCG_05813 [Schizosaccharomyces octosporus yFS286]EPX73301.1 hypothetical protein SOCG_05813 [Schizosaccharomyces octosporus yFS286]